MQMDAAFAKVIGYELKKEQTEAIYSVLSGSDVLVVLPTNFDKSMIYQALLWLSVYLGQRTSPIVLVISPLVAQMKNQVVLMKRKGINAAFIGEEQQDQQVISTIRACDIALVYGSPEAILSASWRSMFVQVLKFGLRELLSNQQTQHQSLHVSLHLHHFIFIT